MYKQKSNSAHCKSREVVHTKVCGDVFFVYTSIKLKKSKINPYNLNSIKDKDKSIKLSDVERKSFIFQI